MRVRLATALRIAALLIACAAALEYLLLDLFLIAPFVAVARAGKAVVAG